MKKIFLSIIMLLVAFGLVGCSVDLGGGGGIY